LRIVLPFDGIGRYIDAARAQPEAELRELWSQYAVAPYWDEWGAGQFNEERTRAETAEPPGGREGLDALAADLEQLARADVGALISTAYARISAALPPALAERAVCVYPADPRNASLLSELNGVVGSCVGDNILLRINPRGADWRTWAAYVMAHEYHHTLWGYNYFAVRGKTEMSLLVSLLVDGQADSFAMSLHPGLSPAWTRALSPGQAREQWRRMQPHLGSGDPDLYRRFFFGDAVSETPAFTAYTIGYRIVQGYLQNHPEVQWAELLDVDAGQVLADSGWEE
jgi:uncharacterized protein YjaZ